MRDEPPEGSSTATGSDPLDPDYDDWPIDDDRRDSASYVGAMTDGTPVFHHQGTIFHGEPDSAERKITPKPDTERDLEPGETLGDALSEIGDRLGWESLSEFGEQHLGDESEA